jgi:hypothetical protein
MQPQNCASGPQSPLTGHADSALQLPQTGRPTHCAAFLLARGRQSGTFQTFAATAQMSGLAMCLTSALMGQSGLGLEGQRAEVAAYVLGKGEVAAEFVEVESGKRADWTCHAKVPVSQLMLGSPSLESQGTFPAKG